MNGITTYQKLATQFLSSKDVQRDVGAKESRRDAKNDDAQNAKARGDEVEISREGQLRAEVRPLLKKLADIPETRAMKVQEIIEKHERGELVNEESVSQGIRQMLIFGAFAH